MGHCWVTTQEGLKLMVGKIHLAQICQLASIFPLRVVMTCATIKANLTFSSAQSNVTSSIPKWPCKNATTPQVIQEKLFPKKANSRSHETLVGLSFLYQITP